MRWTPRQQRYQLWLALPDSLKPRDIRTDAQFAKASGVSVATLKLWKYQPGFYEAMASFTRSVIGDQLANILQAIVDEALAGTVSAQKLALEYLGLHKAVVKHELEEDRLVIIMSPEDAQRVKQEALPVPTAQPVTIDSQVRTPSYTGAPIIIG